MRTRNKLIFIQILTFIILLLAIIAVQLIQQYEQNIFINSKTKSDELIIENILKSHEKEFLSAAKTNSCWNEIVEFVLKPDSNWAKPAIGEFVNTFELNYCNVINAQKKSVYAVYEKFDKKGNNIDITPDMIDFLFGKGPFCHFFIKIKDGYIEFFGSTIVRIDDIEHKGKAYGYLLIGKFWSSNFIKLLENISGFKIKIADQIDTEIVNDRKVYLDEKKIIISKPIRDWKNNQIAHIQFEIVNQLSERYYYYRYLTFLIAIFSVITILFLFIVVRNWISRPLTRITRSLSKEDISILDELITKKNEFGEVSRLIKQFYSQKNDLKKEISEKLKVEEELKSANDNLENKVKERTADLSIINLALETEISERKKAEEIIKMQLLDLELKNSEMERFTYTVSHDLKSPLITINGFAGLIQEKIRAKDYDGLEEDVKRISNATIKMQELLKDLLELSRVGRMTNPPVTFKMTDLVNEVVELLQGILKEKNIKISVQDNMPEVKADKQRIKEVLQNLIENAVKFMRDKENSIIHVGCKMIDQEQVFYVEDNGVGIDERYYQKIFGLFNKLSQHSEGTGIGLALVKRIVELHNGKVWVESEINKGSTFYFTLK